MESNKSDSARRTAFTEYVIDKLCKIPDRISNGKGTTSL
jgi:hypothetical protein